MAQALKLQWKFQHLADLTLTKGLDRKQKMPLKHLKLKVLPGQFKYVLFEPNVDLNAIVSPITKASPAAFFVSAEEVSAILPSDALVPEVKSEPGWSCIRVIGEMPFGTVEGLISNVSSTLKTNGLGLCVVSMFRTDWFFIRTKNIDLAVEGLKKAGWNFVD